MSATLMLAPRGAAPTVAAAGPVLSARDLGVMGWVSEQYAIRIDHLALLLGRGERTAQRFGARMRCAGLVDCRVLLVGEPAWLWLTAAGQRLAPAGFRGWTPRLGLLAHIAAVNTVRLYVSERSPGSVWVCERALARDLPRQAHLPDAVILTAGARHAVEVELTPKSQRRLTAILDELCGGYDRVLYFATPASARQLERLGASERWPKLALRDLPQPHGRS